MTKPYLTRLVAAAMVTSSLVIVPTAASAAPTLCQGGAAGCLLPLAQPATPLAQVPVYQAPVEAAPVAVAERARPFPILLVLGALAAIGGILAIVLSNDDNDRPVSP